MLQFYVATRTEQVNIKGFNFIYNFFRYCNIPFVLSHQNKCTLQRSDIPVHPTARFVLENCFLGGNFALK
jgi:hypothetical protein